LIYVYDLLNTGNSITNIKSLKKFLHEAFTIKDLGDAKFILGIEIARSKQEIVLFQRKYVLELLKDTRLLDAKPVSCPSDPNIKLQK